MKPLIGSVPYLNARPLIAWFETPEGAERAQLLLDVPSRLAQLLERREIHVGMISSFEALRRENAVVIPEVAIASCGAVKSVRLFSRVPFERIASLALDASSLTSNNLARVLLAELFDARPSCEPNPPDLANMLSSCDAAVLIGDPGMAASADGLYTLDLGLAWRELTGLPFVWAVWIANGDSHDPALTESIIRAKEFGVQRIREVALREAARLGWPAEVCLDYLTNAISFDLGPDRLDALRVFQALCVKHGLVDHERPIRLAERAEYASPTST